jgi:hypothetical protein
MIARFKTQRAALALLIALTAGLSSTTFAGPKKSAAGGKGVRERHITREATIKSKDQSKLDFDAVDIGGERKTPMGTLINQNKADKNYDFVKVRLRWHPEMVQSATSLDTGSSNN